MSTVPAIAIDFKKSARAERFSAVLLLAGGFVLAVGGAFLFSIEADIENLDAQKSEISKMMRRAPSKVAASGRDNREVQLEVRIANGVIEQMVIPWDRLFDRMESAADEEIALLSIQPDAANRMVRINGEAKSFAAMLDYSRRLEGTDLLTSVFLMSHEIKTQDPQKPVAFALSANWSERQ